MSTPSPGKFAERVMARMRRAGVEGEIEYDDENFKLVYGEGCEAHLHNVYNQYCATQKGDRMGVIAFYVKALVQTPFEIPETFDDARSNVLPRVRERAYNPLTSMAMQLQGHDPPGWLSVPLSEHLIVELCYDQPMAIAGVGRSMLDDWGVEFDETMAVARENLARVSDAPFESPLPGVFISPWQDSHDASRMILLDVIRRLDVTGDPVVLVPSRDYLIVTGSADHEGLSAASAIASQVLDQEPRSMTGHAVRLEGESWSPYLPPLGHPAHSAFRELQLQSIVGDYTEQKELLDEQHQRDDVDVFVGTPQAFHNEESGEYTVLATWTSGVHTMLVRADKVAFMMPTDDFEDCEPLGIAIWHRVMSVAGDLMEDQGIYPPRYLVRGFPSPDQLDEIGLVEGL